MEQSEDKEQRFVYDEESEHHKMTKREGPYEVVVPEQRYQSCNGCTHLTHKLWKSGRNPEYRNYCKLEKGYSAISQEGRQIDSDDVPVRTPEWCPIIKSKNDEKEKH